MLLDFGQGDRRVFLAAASAVGGVFVKSQSPTASTYEVLLTAGAVEELPSPVAGFACFGPAGRTARPRTRKSYCTDGVVRMRMGLAAVVVPLGLLAACGSASSQTPRCSDPEALKFLRSQLDRPFDGAKSLLGVIEVPIPGGLRYELSGMAAIENTGLMLTCTAQATPVSDDGETYGVAEVVYTLVRNDAGGLNIRLRTDALEQLQGAAYGGVMMRAVREGRMPGQSTPTHR